MLAKGATFAGGIALSSSLGLLKNKDGEDLLSRGWRRGVRLGGGVGLIVWGGRVHPLVKLLGWAIAAPEVAFTSIELISKWMGRPIEVGALDSPFDDYGHTGGSDWEDPDFGDPDHDDHDEDDELDDLEHDDDEAIVLDV